MTGEPGWRRDVAAIIQATQFDAAPESAVDRLVELIVATDVFPGTPEGNLTSVRAALTSVEALAELVPQPHSEGAVRGMLEALRQRLAQWLARDPGFTELPADQWRPTRAATLVAHLEREPQLLSRWLGVEFHRVAEEQFDARIAVLRLSSGDAVALIQVPGNPVPGTSLFQAASQPRERLLDRFLADTGLPPGVVGETTDTQAGRP